MTAESDAAKKSVGSTETCSLDFEIRRSQVNLELAVGDEGVAESRNQVAGY